MQRLGICLCGSLCIVVFNYKKNYNDFQPCREIVDFNSGEPMFWAERSSDAVLQAHLRLALMFEVNLTRHQNLQFFLPGSSMKLVLTATKIQTVHVKSAQLSIASKSKRIRCILMTTYVPATTLCPHQRPVLSRPGIGTVGMCVHAKLGNSNSNNTSSHNCCFNPLTSCKDQLFPSIELRHIMTDLIGCYPMFCHPNFVPVDHELSERHFFILIGIQVVKNAWVCPASRTLTGAKQQQSEQVLREEQCTTIISAYRCREWRKH